MTLGIPRLLTTLSLLWLATGGAACSRSESPDSGAPSATASAPAPAPPPAPRDADRVLSADDIRRERLLFQVKVLGFDASRPRGEGAYPADSVRLRVSNGSSLTLPCLTIHTHRWSGGEIVGRSRTPAVETGDIAPGATVELDYFPHGHLDSIAVDSITVEIREIQQSMAESSICELRGWR